MEYLIIAVVVLASSLLTFYSGFGLGTILMPVVALFLPLPIAIFLTAVVHFLHNFLKASLLWKSIDWKITIRFGIVAAVAAIFGALLLQRLSLIPPLMKYSLFSIPCELSILHLLVGSLLILFATIDLFQSKVKKIENLYLGGALSGFFGGLSGHQGAFRSAFLIHLNLSKEGFIATNAMISMMVDLVRLPIYGWSFWRLLSHVQSALFIEMILFALLGIGFGMIWLKKFTFASIKTFVVILLYLFGLSFILGVV